MAEFEDKLNSILGNQEAMGQIMALAQSLSGSGDRQAPEQGAPPDEGDGWEAVEPTPGAGTPLPPMGDLMGMLGDLDPQMIQTGMRLMGELSSGENRSAQVLYALKPFLKKRRQARVDRAIQVAQLARVVRLLFDTMGDKGGGAHV